MCVVSVGEETNEPVFKGKRTVRSASVCDERAPDEAPGCGVAMIQEFEKLCEEHGPALGRFVRGLCGNNEDDAKDIIQETYIRVWQHFPTYYARGCGAALLCRIARNVFIDETRRTKRLVPMPVGWKALAAGSPGPEDIAVTRDLFSKASEKLSTIDRNLIHHRCISGLSARETAEIMGLTTGAVNTGLTRARRRLREAVDSLLCADGIKTEESPNKREGGNE